MTTSAKCEVRSAKSEGRRTLSQAEWLAEGKRRFGPDVKQWRFVCPSCNTEQTIQDLKDAGLSSEEIHGVMAYSCIGRFNRSKGCDWTLGGLLQIHTLEVMLDENGHKRPTFEFAGAVEEEPRNTPNTRKEGA